MKPRNNFLEQIKRSREDARAVAEAATASKAVSEITAAELDQDAERLSRELRASKEQAVEAGRREAVGRGSGRPIFPRRTRRPWK